MWYNVIVQKQNPQEHYTAYQLKLPVEIEKIIEISDPVYSFSEVMDHIDLNKYLTIEERRPDCQAMYISTQLEGPVKPGLLFFSK